MAAPRVLMVCLGNICRSPMAEGILKRKARLSGLVIFVDSAGTSSWHQDERPDPRAIAEMEQHGIDISGQRARPFKLGDFDKFDHILVMDSSNQTDVLAKARNDSDREKVKLILDLASDVKGESVPDPYYDNSFGPVYELLDHACDVFIRTLK